MIGWRLLFWLHANTRALTDSGYWSGVVICFSMRQPITRASSAESSIFIRARRPDLPYAHPVRGREVELLARLDVERLVPRIEVAYRIGAILRRRVTVDDDPLAQRRLADLLPPALPEAEEEELLGAEAGDRRRGAVARG